MTHIVIDELADFGEKERALLDLILRELAQEILRESWVRENLLSVVDMVVPR